MILGLYGCGFSLSVEHANTCLFGPVIIIVFVVFVCPSVIWPVQHTAATPSTAPGELPYDTRSSKLAPAPMESIVFANSPLAEYLEGLYRMLS